MLIAWLRTDSKGAAARSLFISHATISTHIGRIHQKYADAGRSAPSKVLLAIRAIQDGIIGIDGL